jgi:serine/threonine protein phosphatase 1
MMRTYVIGDIHGCLDELRHLIDGLPLEVGDRLVFLGDYIDRGPNSKGVVSYLLGLKEYGPALDLVFLKGNHEDMLLSYLGLLGNHGDMFFYNGGRETLASYGLPSVQPTPNEARSAIPATHLDFYQSLIDYYAMGDILCVHAGIDPHKPLEEQSTTEVLWIRDEFIYSEHALPYTVLFGHTPKKEVFFHLPYKVGLDTGLVYGNKLTCLETQENILYQIGRGKKKVQRTPISDKWAAASPLSPP